LRQVKPAGLSFGRLVVPRRDQIAARLTCLKADPAAMTHDSTGSLASVKIGYAAQLNTAVLSSLRAQAGRPGQPHGDHRGARDADLRAGCRRDSRQSPVLPQRASRRRLATRLPEWL